MREGIAEVLDVKSISGAVLTAGAAGITWIETANGIGQLVLTVVGICVGIVTLVYTIERLKFFRNNRKGD